MHAPRTVRACRQSQAIDCRRHEGGHGRPLAEIRARKRSQAHDCVGNLGAVVRRVQDGELADIVILPGQGIDGLVKDGKARADDRAVLARSGIGVAVRKDASRPDISTPEAFKRVMLAARSITYLDPAGGGTSGIHIARVLDRLGIADEMRAKTILHANARAAGSLVAGGDAEIGMNLIQEFMPLPDIDLVGPLPSDLQNTLVFFGVIMTGARDRLASKALIGRASCRERV